MKFATGAGLGMPGDRTAAETMRDAIELAVRAEELGYDYVTLAEHHFSDYVGVASPAVVGAAIAARTENIRIVLAISVLALHNPVTVAEEYALLDVISDGRLDFGVGRGYQPGEFKGHNIPLSESRGRFEESLEIIEGLWSTPDFSYEGKFYNVDHLTLYPRPVQERVPLRVAAVSPDSFERVARMHKDLMCAPSITPLEKIKASLDIYRNTLIEEGEDPADYSIFFPDQVYIGETEEECYNMPKAPMEWFQRRNSQLMTAGLLPTDPGYSFYKKAQANRSRFDYDKYYKRGTFVFCSADEAIRRIKERETYLGITDMSAGCMLATKEQALNNMQRIAEQVMPAFR
jgi:alkanesulfonate monooxygenase SsuD/methylene tetrahydromethanopterin reductase-like flavin-dependent oxidoreductase (luciferase family)